MASAVNSAICFTSSCLIPFNSAIFTFTGVKLDHREFDWKITAVFTIAKFQPYTLKIGAKMMKTKAKVPINCLFQACYNPELEAEISKCKEKCYRYNQLSPNDRETQLKMLAEILGRMGDNVIFTPPFWCDYGYNISVGDYFYANHNLIITDGAQVSFGNNVFIAPNCCFTTAEHAIDPEQRKAGMEIAKPITIGNNVWIGAGATILAGVTIGDNSVIGAGSVVSKSIPSNVVAVGVPCRVMRKITEEDKYRYPVYKGD